MFEETRKLLGKGLSFLIYSRLKALMQTISGRSKMVSGERLLALGVAVAAVGLSVWYLYRRRKAVKAIQRRNANGIVQFLSLEEKHELKLVKKTIISPNTRLFRFKLLSDDHVPGLRAGEHVVLSAIVDGKLVERKYTPVSSDELLGYLELIIKIYPANNHPNFPLGGVFSQHLERLEIGDKVWFSGPVTKITYEGNGHFLCRKLGTKIVEDKYFKKLGIVVGGTGITPMLQIINVILKNPNDKTQIWMLFANNSPTDVLLKDKLDQLAIDYRGRFTVWYTVSLPSDDWMHSVGHVNQELLAKHLPPAHSDNGILLCGPPGLKQKAAIPNLLNIGYTKEQILDF